jgi:hypothetical protein
MPEIDLGEEIIANGKAILAGLADRKMKVKAI